MIFTVLPGHVAQISDTLHALPFVCLGMVLGYAMLRTGALLPAVVVHALLNLATIAAFEGEISTALRSSLAATAAGRAGPRHRRGRPPARHLPAGAGRRGRARDLTAGPPGTTPPISC